MAKQSAGFTVIEIIVVILLLAGASVLFFIQKNAITVAREDDQRKTAINAMYYNLEEVFFKKNNYYPDVANANTLPAMDPALFKDPEGVQIGDGASDYRYEPTSCTDGRCKGYTLRADLAQEADYVRTNR